MLASPTVLPRSRRWSAISRAVTEQLSSATASITSLRGALSRWPASASAVRVWSLHPLSAVVLIMRDRLERVRPARAR